MKYLQFLRHGKAESYSFNKQDFERNLAERGKRNSEQISQILLRSTIIPKQIISSPANRTIQTARIFAENIDFNPDDIITKDFLYDYVGVSQIAELLKEISEAQEVVLFVGHNPWISSVASELTNGFYQDMPTAALVCLAFDVDSWSEIDARKGKLVFYEYPKKYN